MTDCIRLSICIPTLNRARFIGETLDSIVPQLTPEVEIVFVDGGSTDGAGNIIRSYMDRYPQIRYFNTGTGGPVVPNAGFDADCDYSVEQARGEHCWLFSDDDIIKPGAVAAVLRELGDGDPDLLIVDSEVRDLSLRQLFEPSRLPLRERRDYRPVDRNAFMADAGNSLSFLGVVIIRRSCWMERDRKAYYGSLFLHVGVIFQEPFMGHARILPDPLVQIRMGNAMWTDRSFEIWMLRWPGLIWGFNGYSDEAKAAVVAREPWRERMQLMLYRAYGSFRASDYRKHLAPQPRYDRKLAARFIAATPGWLAHALMTAWIGRRDRDRTHITYNLAVASRNTNCLSRLIARRLRLAPYNKLS